ncbi:MAG: hypothetical protein B6D58_09255 [candidate division Zixibacteria bacterium 4484_95]|nr:MAG: hypothetical protein B6D58_09255 [candidate division Zixibacteria bacterium 4484_95]RKX20886.1 MAG: hypothetical protein DRP26_00775 [candidate division Zixibacteria bacterium]
MNIYKILIVILSTALVVVAQEYTIDRYVIASGGGFSESDNYRVDGTIGQPIVGISSSENYVIEAGFWMGAGVSSGCDFTPGDANGDGSVMGNDVTYSVRYFKGIGSPPPDSCQYQGGWLYSGGDANGNCVYAGSDVTFLVGYFKGYNPEILYCPETPPINEPVLLAGGKEDTPLITTKKGGDK